MHRTTHLLASTFLLFLCTDSIVAVNIAPRNVQQFAQNYTPYPTCKRSHRVASDPGQSRGTAITHGIATLLQPIDHSNPSLGNFSQRYLWNTTFWSPESGAPIVVFLPGEASVDGYEVYSRPDFSTVGVLAESLGAAVVIPEHRYYGKSSPFSVLSTANLTYLTVDNALKDVVRLAKEFQAPWTESPSTASDVPWILTGGSYSAAQTAWIANIMPGTYWAYLSASPVVQAVSSYWQYYMPVLEYGPPTCVALLSDIIDLVDRIFTLDADNFQKVQSLFKLGGAEPDDFMYHGWSHVTFWAEQDTARPPTNFDAMCEALYGHPMPTQEGDWAKLIAEVLHEVHSTHPERADLSTGYERTLQALLGYAEQFGALFSMTLCISGVCTNSSDPSSLTHTDVRVDNIVGRQLRWLKCNDMIGGDVTGAPINETSLCSRHTTSAYFEKQCRLSFPPGPNGETYGAAKGVTTETFNNYSGGWFPTKAERIIYSSGEKEVWREMSVSAKTRPGGPMQSDPDKKIVVHHLQTGFHHSDLYTLNTELDGEVRKVRDQEISQLCTWVQQWDELQHGRDITAKHAF